MAFAESGSTKELEELVSGLSAVDAGAPWVKQQKNFLERVRGANVKTAVLEGAPLLFDEQSTTTPPQPGDPHERRVQQEEQSAKLRARLQLEPENHLVWSQLGRTELLLDNREEALRCVRKAMELVPESLDQMTGSDYRLVLAYVHLRSGDKDSAIAEYTHLLRIPGAALSLNVHEMKYDPRFAPLRSDPRFEALLNDPMNNAPLF